MGWGYVEVYFGWVGVGGHLIWMGGTAWGYILARWGKWTFFYGWVRVVRDKFWAGGGGWTFFMGEWGWMGVGGGIFWVGWGG